MLCPAAVQVLGALRRAPPPPRAPTARSLSLSLSLSRAGLGLCGGPTVSRGPPLRRTALKAPPSPAPSAARPVARRPLREGRRPPHDTPGPCGAPGLRWCGARGGGGARTRARPADAKGPARAALHAAAAASKYTKSCPPSVRFGGAVIGGWGAPGLTDWPMAGDWKALRRRRWWSCARGWGVHAPPFGARGPQREGMPLGRLGGERGGWASHSPPQHGGRAALPCVAEPHPKLPTGCCSGGPVRIPYNTHRPPPSDLTSVIPPVVRETWHWAHVAVCTKPDRPFLPPLPSPSASPHLTHPHTHLHPPPPPRSSLK